METVPEIIEKIKTDERRRKFFKDRLQSDLKRLGISCQEEQIEQYMIEAIHTFHGNLSVQLFPHILKYTKEKIFKEEKHERKYEKNNLFSDEEMVIIEQYLEKDQNGHYKDTEEIANNLGTTITEVTKTTYKLNQQFIKKPKQIKQIFGDIEKTLKMRQRKKDRRSKNKHLITKQDIEIIGIFTGQINDICLDIDELAVKKNTTSQKMLERLRNIYQLLDIEENYSELIKQYPNIHSMLKLKCRTLGISAPVMVAVFECVNFFKTLYQKDEKGNYLKLNEVAQKLGFRHYSTFVSKRKTLLKRLEDDEDFQRKVLVKYPTFIRDKEQYEKNFNNTEPSQNKQEQKPHQVQEKKPKPKQKTKSKRLENDIIFLQYLYKKQENGRYLTNSEIAKLLDIKVTSISTKKTNTLKKLENKVYKAKILERYPELDEDIKKKESTQEENDRSKQLSNNEKKLADFLFTDQTRELGSQSSYARKLEITPNYYYLLKDNTLSKIKNNPNIQKSYPSFLVENEIISKYRRKNSITLSKQEFNQIKKNARKYDIPNYQQEKPNRKDLFMKGIKSLENSEYSNYTSLCTFEQKAMLALRLGFFNEMSFSSSDVAELFHVEQEEVQILTQECIKSSKDLPLNDKNQKIKATKK